MSPDMLRVLMASPGEWALFDVREAGEAETGHILGATFLPRRQIELRIEELVADRRTQIIVYDDGGDRAALAAKTLRELGYGRTDILYGGLPAWLDMGGKVAKGSNVPSKQFGEEVFVDRQVPQVTADELADLVDQDDVVICDIRLRSEHETARVPNAHYIGNFDIALAAKQLADTGKAIVCHCAGRTRSILGAQTLVDLGVERAYALKDGTMGWVLSGRELEKGPVRHKLEPEADSVAAAMASVENLARENGVQWRKAEELFIELDKRSQGLQNGYFFDVRQLEDYEAGHIPGTQALPGGQAILRADDFIAIRNALIIVIDEGGVCAGMTALWLRRLGYRNVYACRDAIETWRASGRDLEIGRGRALPVGLEAAKAAASGLTVAQAREFLAEHSETTVVNVDNSKSFAARHLPGSVWVQRGWLEDRISVLVPDKSKPVLVTSGSELQSIFAAATLNQLGYEKVHYLSGGVAAWHDAGLDIEDGLPKESDRETSDLVLPPYARGKEGMKRYLSWEKDLQPRTNQSGHSQEV